MTAPTKILHLSHTDVRTDSRIIKEVAALSSRSPYPGYSLDVHVFGIEDRTSSWAPSSSTTKAKFTVLKIPSYLYSLYKPLSHLAIFFIYSIVFVRSGLRVSPSIIHCHDVFCLPASCLLKIICRNKPVLIYDAHELESNTNGQLFLESLIVFITEKTLWILVNALITVSPSIERWYAEKIGSKPSYLVYNAPVVGYSPLFNQKTHDIKSSLGLHPSDFLFAYVGIIGKGRGIPIIIEAFMRQNKYHAVFIGSGELTKLVLDASCRSSYIHHLPPVPHDQLTALLSCVNIGLCLVEKVSLSDYYCLPNKFFEYIFSGTPVISSRFPDLAHLIDNYSLGITINNDADSLLDALDVAADVQPTIDVDAINHLSWPYQEDRLLQCYQDMIKTHLL